MQNTAVWPCRVQTAVLSKSLQRMSCCTLCYNLHGMLSSGHTVPSKNSACMGNTWPLMTSVLCLPGAQVHQTTCTGSPDNLSLQVYVLLGCWPWCFSSSTAESPQLAKRQLSSGENPAQLYIIPLWSQIAIAGFSLILYMYAVMIVSQASMKRVIIAADGNHTEICMVIGISERICKPSV